MKDKHDDSLLPEHMKQYLGYHYQLENTISGHQDIRFAHNYLDLDGTVVHTLNGTTLPEILKMLIDYVDVLGSRPNHSEYTTVGVHLQKALDEYYQLGDVYKAPVSHHDTQAV